MERKAIKSGLNLSEYIRAQLSKGDGKRQDIEMVSQCVILCQDILNIIREKYSCEDNSLLEEKVEKLWKRLFLWQKRRKRLNVFYIIFEQEREEKVWMKWIAITAPDIFYGSWGLTREKKFAVIPEALKVLKIIWNMR